MKYWIESLVIFYIVFSLYRRFSMRKTGEAVGRAKAKVYGTKTNPNPAPAVAKSDPGLSPDFGTLDLKPGANFDDVKSAYRELAKVWHPDRFGHDAKLKERANIKLGEINAAYERLKNHFGK